MLSDFPTAPPVPGALVCGEQEEEEKTASVTSQVCVHTLYVRVPRMGYVCVRSSLCLWGPGPGPSDTAPRVRGRRGCTGRVHMARPRCAARGVASSSSAFSNFLSLFSRCSGDSVATDPADTEHASCMCVSVRACASHTQSGDSDPRPSLPCLREVPQGGSSERGGEGGGVRVYADCPPSPESIPVFPTPEPGTGWQPLPGPLAASREGSAAGRPPTRHRTQKTPPVLLGCGCRLWWTLSLTTWLPRCSCPDMAGRGQRVVSRSLSSPRSNY